MSQRRILQDDPFVHRSAQLAASQKWALVVQGGGQRGIFTAGVLDAFLERQFDPFSLYIGTSAGALNLSSFLSRQSGFGRDFILNFTTQDEFFNLYRYLGQQKPINLDWALQKVQANGEMPLDFSTARGILHHRDAFACATRKDTLKDIYLPMYQDDWQSVLKASCAIPFLYNQPVLLNDMEWVDGGVSAAIPVKAACEQAAQTIVVIRTEPIDHEVEAWSIFEEWRERIETLVPQYIERLTHEMPFEKVKHFQWEMGMRLSQWRQRWNEKTQKYPKVAWAQSPQHFDVQALEKTHPPVEKSTKRSEFLEMLTRHYQNTRESEILMKTPPETTRILQIAPKSPLRSRALLSDLSDLKFDYALGKQLGQAFIEQTFLEMVPPK